MENRLRRPPSRRRSKMMAIGAAGLLVASILAACSGASSSPSASAGESTVPGTAPASAPGSAAALGGTINWMGFEGEDGGTLDLVKTWLADNNLELKTTSTPQSDMVVAQAKLGNVIDVASVNNGYVPVLAKAGLLTRPLPLPPPTSY